MRPSTSWPGSAPRSRSRAWWPTLAVQLPAAHRFSDLSYRYFPRTHREQTLQPRQSSHGPPQWYTNAWLTLRQERWEDSAVCGSDIAANYERRGASEHLLIARQSPPQAVPNSRRRRAEHVGKHKSISLDNHSRPDVDGACEHGRTVDERVEFAFLAARIRRCRQLGQERRIELAAGERSGDLRWVHTANARFHAAGNHLPGKFGRRRVPERKERFQARACELRLPVGTDVREKEVAKRDSSDIVRQRPLAHGPHARLVVVVGTRPWQVHFPERQAGLLRLRPHQIAPDGVHRHTIGVGVEGGEQRDNVDVGTLTKHVQCPGAVLSAAPGEQDFLHDASRSSQRHQLPCDDSPMHTPWSISATISAVRDTVMPDRLKKRLPSAMTTDPSRTARRSRHPG